MADGSAQRKPGFFAKSRPRSARGVRELPTRCVLWAASTFSDGLFSSTNRLRKCFHRRDPFVLSSCEWIIELGPEGGSGGGRIIAEGTPESLRNNPASLTGRYLLGDASLVN